MGVRLDFPKNFPEEEKVSVLAEALVNAHNHMLKEGYLIMSPSDVAERYGKTRQYWEKLLKEGKIQYQQTSAGMITSDLWIKAYLNNKEGVDEYVRLQNRVLESIKETKRNYGKVVCPKCKELDFDFSVNPNNVNGICRARCGFRINTVKSW